MVVDYSIIKSFVTTRSLSVQFIETAEKYFLAVFDGPFSLESVLDKNFQPEDCDDFEATIKANGNKKIQPTDPALGRVIYSASAFAVNTDYEVKATGFKGTAAAGTTTDLHYPVGIEDRYINGLEVLAEGSMMNDTVAFMVTDQDNLLGHGAGVTLKQFGFTWNIAPDKVGQGIVAFNWLARIPAGFYIRVRYLSTGGTNVKVACNLLLNRKVP